MFHCCVIHAYLCLLDHSVVRKKKLIAFYPVALSLYVKDYTLSVFCVQCQFLAHCYINRTIIIYLSYSLSFRKCPIHDHNILLLCHTSTSDSRNIILSTNLRQYTVLHYHQ